MKYSCVFFVLFSIVGCSTSSDFNRSPSSLDLDEYSIKSEVIKSKYLFSAMSLRQDIMKVIYLSSEGVDDSPHFLNQSGKSYCSVIASKEAMLGDSFELRSFELFKDVAFIAGAYSSIRYELRGEQGNQLNVSCYQHSRTGRFMEASEIIELLSYVFDLKAPDIEIQSKIFGKGNVRRFQILNQD